MIDTENTYTLMQESLFRQLGDLDARDNAHSPQRFIMAHGKIHQAKTQRTLIYNWHSAGCRLKTYVMRDSHLAFPLKAGLYFLTATGALLEIA